MNFSEKDYYLGFAVFGGIGPARFKLLKEYFGSAKDAWMASEKDLLTINLGNKLTSEFIYFRGNFSLTSFLKNLEKKKINFLTEGDRDYPQKLLQIDAPPIVLFVLGNNPQLLNKKRLVAVVGTRLNTVYGKNTCRTIVSGLTAFGAVIVSGMAKGIDTIAHRTAIEANGATIAVLGTGIDIIYPFSNYGLYWQIVNKSGLVISEYPPGFTPTRTSFPLRNRIISGISEGTVVIEGKKTSGAMITARYALDQGREVFAVPGPVNSPTSEGTTYLIKQGANVASNAQDILDGLKFDKRK